MFMHGKRQVLWRMWIVSPYSGPEARRACKLSGSFKARNTNQGPRGQDRHLKTQIKNIKSFHTSSHLTPQWLLKIGINILSLQTEESEAQVTSTVQGHAAVRVGFCSGLLDPHAHGLGCCATGFTSCKGADADGIRAYHDWEQPRGFLLPSLSLPSSAADPFGKMVLTKIPICPRMQSRPPAMLKPRPYTPSRRGSRVSLQYLTEGICSCISI